MCVCRGEFLAESRRIWRAINVICMKNVIRKEGGSVLLKTKSAIGIK